MSIILNIYNHIKNWVRIREIAEKLNNGKMQEIELEEYCKYCGEDANKGHSEDCPLVHGIRTSEEGYIAFGFKADPFDREFNLHVARHGKLFAFNNGHIGPTDKKIGARLAHEHFKFVLKRHTMHKL